MEITTAILLYLKTHLQNGRNCCSTSLIYFINLLHIQYKNWERNKLTLLSQGRNAVTCKLVLWMLDVQRSDGFIMTSFPGEKPLWKMSLMRNQIQGFIKAAVKISWCKKTALLNVKFWLHWTVLLQIVILKSHQSLIPCKCLLQSGQFFSALPKQFWSLSPIRTVHLQFLGTEDSECLWRTGSRASISYTFSSPYLFLFMFFKLRSVFLFSFAFLLSLESSFPLYLRQQHWTLYL